MMSSVVGSFVAYACASPEYERLAEYGWKPLRICARTANHRPQFTAIRPIFKLRIYNSGFRAKQILKRRRWIFLAHRLIS